jgi:hypothetical protein
VQHYERRDALKLAGAAAVVTALSAAGSSSADEPAGQKPRAAHGKKPSETIPPPVRFEGRIYSVRGNSEAFTFAIKDCYGVMTGFEIDLPDDMLVRLVLLAFEQGLCVSVVGEKLTGDNQVYRAEVVGIMR